MPRTKIYVGGMVDDVANESIRRIFEKFGKIRKVWVARNPGSRGYAFVDFFDPEAAENATKEMDGKHEFGVDIKVELSSNGKADTFPTRDRRREDRYHDSRERRSPSPSYNRSRGRSRRDEHHVNEERERKLFPRTLDLLDQLERVTRLRLERELLDEYRHTSSDDNLSYLPLDPVIEEIYQSRRRYPHTDESRLATSRSTLPASYMRTNSPHSRLLGPSRFDHLLPTPPSHVQSPILQGYPPSPEQPDNHRRKYAFGDTRMTFDNKRPHPYNAGRNNKVGKVRNEMQPNDLKHNNPGHWHHSDWYGDTYYGFGFLPSASSGGHHTSASELTSPSMPSPDVYATRCTNTSS